MSGRIGLDIADGIARILIDRPDKMNAILPEMVRELQRPLFPGFTAAALDRLRGHDWPGNVRELRNAVERSAAAADPDEPLDHIILDPFESPWRPTAAPTARVEAAPVTEKVATPEFDGGILDQVRAFEAAMLREALERNRFNQRQTAEALGLGYHQLRGMLKKHGLIPPTPLRP